MGMLMRTCQITRLRRPDTGSRAWIILPCALVSRTTSRPEKVLLDLVFLILDFVSHLCADLIVVANGVHEKDEVLDATCVTSHWRLDQRCPSYLICWAVGDFQIGNHCLVWQLHSNRPLSRRT